MKSLMEELCEITPQRPLFEVAKECDIAFADHDLQTGIETKVVDDPFHSGLDFTLKHKKVSLVVIDQHFTKIKPDASWMQALRLYHEMEDFHRREKL